MKRGQSVTFASYGVRQTAMTTHTSRNGQILFFGRGRWMHRQSCHPTSKPKTPAIKPMLTPHQAKADAAARLQKAGITATLRAKTVDLSDLARVSPVFVYLKGDLPADWKAKAFGDLPKLTDGGYIPRPDRGATLNGKPILVG